MLALHQSQFKHVRNTALLRIGCCGIFHKGRDCVLQNNKTFLMISDVIVLPNLNQFTFYTISYIHHHSICVLSGLILGDYLSHSSPQKGALGTFAYILFYMLFIWFCCNF